MAQLNAPLRVDAMPELKVYPTESAQAQAAAELFLSWGRDAIAARGRFRVALSGGRGPRGLFQALAQRPQALDWGKVELYWVDERWVDWGSPESNYGEARRLWLAALEPGPRCFPLFDASLEPEAAALAYEKLLTENFAAALPVFDLMLLGMGPDGHTASLFPGQASLDETRRLCLAVRHPASGQERLTLTLPVLNASRRCVFLLSGAEKAALMAQVLAGRAQVPAARVRPPQGELLWLSDAAAAAQVA
ncbi:MAG TPA: 6-phosphogluconolactonase [bacterium]|jgi:6-phosphogluconolactonase|nr:6-phosphogluconolactonase [bacterium]